MGHGDAPCQLSHKDTTPRRDGGMKENDIIILRGLVAWCEKKCIDEVLGKWSAVVDANGFNQVDV